MEINKEYVEKIVLQIKSKIKKLPTVAIILGSGLADFVDIMQNKVVIPYSELDGMLKPHVEGHKNQFVVGSVCGKVVIAMQGRFHPYDGFAAKECALPIYIFKLLGAKTCIITNSSGAINKKYKEGDIMLINGHINFTSLNPLIGGAVVDYGKEFVDLKHAYDTNYITKMKIIGKSFGVKFKEGIFVQDLGPSYETPAEVIMMRKMGGDAVSMSTVLEVIAAGQCDLKVLGISCISNKAVSKDDKQDLMHEKVLEVSRKSCEKLKLVLNEFIKEI